MKLETRRILIVSSVRPSRTANVAKRIVRELEGEVICGIVQYPIEQLPIRQRVIASGGNNGPFRKHRSRLTAGISSVAEMAMHAALRFIRGISMELKDDNFGPSNLRQHFGDIGSPLLLTDNISGSNVLKFAKDLGPHLAIMLGSNVPDGELLEIPTYGWICATDEARPNGIDIKVESPRRSSEDACIIAELFLPRQVYDGPVSQTLKADLITDDLTVKSAAEILRTNRAEAAKTVTRWAEDIFCPYLEQLPNAPEHIDETAIDKRHRSAWKLCLHTLLLCSPIIAGRNWYRRLRRRYPIIVLAHHLVTDRPHRMGISTEAFWRQVRFLKKHYRIVSLSEATELLNSGRIDAPTVVLTFDDGYADNFVSLRAVAEETQVPITLFIATQPVEFRQEFRHDLENGIRGSLPLTWQQMRYWSSSRVEFGSHTLTHFDCGSKDAAKLKSEILESKRNLERRLGRPVEFFAFPFGQPENISSEALSVARDGYRFFVSGFGGENHCGKPDHQHLLRKGFYANAWELELDLQSVFDLVKNIKQKLQRARHKPSGVSDVISFIPNRVAEAVAPTHD